MSEHASSRTSDPMIAPESFARFIGIGRRTFQTWRAAGKLPPPDLHMGKTLRWRRDTIDRWLAAQARKGVA